MTTQDHSRSSGDSSDDSSTIDIAEHQGKQREIASFLAANSGTGMDKESIASELEGIEKGDVGVHIPDILSLEFYRVMSEYRNGKNYYYAEFEWAKLGVIALFILAIVGAAVGFYTGAFTNCGGINVV